MAKLPTEVLCPKCGKEITLEWGGYYKLKKQLFIPLTIKDAEDHKDCMKNDLVVIDQKESE